MNRSALEIREHLIKYIERYTSAVKYVGKVFLSGKGQTLEEYVGFMSSEGNCGDELSLYLTTRMCSKQIAVITKTSIWYPGKLDDGVDFVSLSDVDLILVYLGKNVFRGTDPKPPHHIPPQPELYSPSRKDEDYIPPTTSNVYKQESKLPRQHTQPMGSPTISSDTDVDSPPQPQPTPEKSKRHHRKLKHVVVKEKVYKIR